MIVLDTNIISELMALAPDQSVSRWIRQQQPQTLATTSVNLFEIRYGLALLPEGRRKHALAQQFEHFQTLGFRNRVLSFDSQAAGACVDILVERRRQGRPMDNNLPDAMIAAVARRHGAVVATRDIGDFDGCGVDLVNPWTGSVTSRPQP